MNTFSGDREPTLSYLLQRASERITDTQAATACAISTVATALVILLAPSWWRLALGTGSAAAFGAWMIAARSERATVVTRVAQGLAFALGVGLAFALGLSILTGALGIWIS